MCFLSSLLVCVRISFVPKFQFTLSPTVHGHRVMGSLFQDELGSFFKQCELGKLALVVVCIPLARNRFIV